MLFVMVQIMRYECQIWTVRHFIKIFFQQKEKTGCSYMVDQGRINKNKELL